MKQLLKGALCFLPFALAIILINVYADPANVLRTGYENEVATIMASGQNASNVNNMDDRLFMEVYVTMRTQPVDTLVLGSSHAMQTTAQLTGDPNTFAAGVTGADLRDCISIYRMFLEEGFTPKRVILTTDFWFLSEGVVEGRALQDGYREFCKENDFTPIESGAMNPVQKQIEKLVQAISIPYFQSSLEFLEKGMHKTRSLIPTTDFYTTTDMRRADGTISYNEGLRIVTAESTKDRAINYIVSKPLNAQQFNGVSPRLRQQYETFLDELLASGVEVAIAIPPFHPDYYAHMKVQTDNYVDILATEDVVREIAAERGIKVFGSYDPAVCNLEATDFYDGVHCSDTAMYQFYPSDLFE